MPFDHLDGVADPAGARVRCQMSLEARAAVVGFARGFSEDRRFHRAADAAFFMMATAAMGTVFFVFRALIY